MHWYLIPNSDLCSRIAVLGCFLVLIGFTVGRAVADWHQAKITWEESFPCFETNVSDGEILGKGTDSYGSYEVHILRRSELIARRETLGLAFSSVKRKPRPAEPQLVLCFSQLVKIPELNSQMQEMAKGTLNTLLTVATKQKTRTCS